MSGLLLIRADASAEIGSGHIMRCLVLAEQWRHAGGAVLFLHASLTPALQRRLNSEGFATAAVEVAPGSDEDAQLTVERARQAGAMWVAADGYAFRGRWQEQIKDAGFRLLVWDDHGHAEHYSADLVLNQNVSADARRYARREPQTQLLLGPNFAHLRGEFRAWRDWQREIPERGTKILITLGGADPDNVTTAAIQALATMTEIEVVIVVGGSNPNLDTIRTAAAVHPHMRVVADATHVAELMAWADIAIAAGGSTSWELAFMGLPTIVIILADNQAMIAAELHRREISTCLGDFRSLDPARLAAEVRALLMDSTRRHRMSQRGRALLDGWGASRVVAAMKTKLKLTIVSDSDSWLNAFLPELKAGFEAAGHDVRWVHEPRSLGEGDIAFFLSLSRIVPANALAQHAHNLVVHESALPHGRGWSPLTWQVLEGKDEIPITLFEAAEGVDSGAIYAQDVIALRGNELVHELRAAQAAATLKLCCDFVGRYPFILTEARAQSGEPTHYPRRRPGDSRLDPDKTLREQFNLLRVADPERYPAFFEMAGRRFEIRVTAV